MQVADGGINPAADAGWAGPYAAVSHTVGVYYHPVRGSQMWTVLQDNYYNALVHILTITAAEIRVSGVCAQDADAWWHSQWLICTEQGVPTSAARSMLLPADAAGAGGGRRCGLPGGEVGRLLVLGLPRKNTRRSITTFARMVTRNLCVDDGEGVAQPIRCTAGPLKARIGRLRMGQPNWPPIWADGGDGSQLFAGCSGRTGHGLGCEYEFRPSDQFAIGSLSGRAVPYRCMRTINDEHEVQTHLAHQLTRSVRHLYDDTYEKNDPVTICCLQVRALHYFWGGGTVAQPTAYPPGPRTIMRLRIAATQFTAARQRNSTIHHASSMPIFLRRPLYKR